MENKSFSIGSALFLISATAVFGQAKFQFVFTGTCSTTDASGRIVPRPINNGTLLQDFAAAVGVTNTSWLALAYHVGGMTSAIRLM
jgi:hypothetical protein